MKFNQKAQNVIEYLLVVAAVVAGALGIAGPLGPMKGAVTNSVNKAVGTIYQDYAWRTQSLTGCDVTCGLGHSTQKVWCQDENGRTVDDSFCASKGPKPLTSVECNPGNCGVYSWVATSDWSACDKLCGNGVQTRTVVCKDSGGATVANGLCSGTPPTSRPCVPAIPAVCYLWSQSNTCVTNCSEPCGVGSCQQSVTCIDNLTHLPTANANCPQPPPSSNWSCNTSLTCGYQWRATGDWSACDQTCGPGNQHLGLQCIRLADNTVVAPGPTTCTAATKPIDIKACNIGPCNHWSVTGTWTTCTKACGTGNQDAVVMCLDKNNVILVNEAPCLAEAGPKPASNRLCNTGACTWGFDSYGACTNTCGNGAQTRNVWCYQAGFPAPLLDANRWCAPTGSPGGDTNPIACSTQTACTQSKPCTGISTCCGNGNEDHFPNAAPPYNEACDLGDFAHGNGNGVCPKKCSSSCTLNGCPCPANPNYAYQSCNYSIPLLNDGQSQGGINTYTANYRGTVDASCDNGTPSYTNQSCISTSCPANPNYNYLGCTFSIPLLTSGQTQNNIATSTSGFTGKVDVSCNNAIPTYTNQSCTVNVCPYPTVANGIVGPFPDCTVTCNQPDFYLEISSTGVPGCYPWCGSGTWEPAKGEECDYNFPPAPNPNCSGTCKCINGTVPNGSGRCVAPTCTNNWINAGCSPAGGCAAGKQYQTNACTGSACGSNCNGAGTTQCVNDASCVAPTCTNNWINAGCSPAGGCAAGKQYQTNACTGSACGSNCNGAGTTQCVIDASCVAPTCTNNWINAGCSPAGGCAAGKQYQTNACTGSACGSNCNGAGTTQCVNDASCVATPTNCVYAAGTSWTDPGTGLPCSADIRVEASPGVSTVALDRTGYNQGYQSLICPASGGSFTLGSRGCYSQGACNNSVLRGCLSGSWQNYNARNCGEYPTWECLGTDTTIDSCTYTTANNACLQCTFSAGQSWTYTTTGYPVDTCYADAAVVANAGENKSVNDTAPYATGYKAMRCNSNGTWAPITSACSSPGVCLNSSLNACSSGKPMNPQSNGCNQFPTWECWGSNGSQDSCTYTTRNAACPVCGGTYNTCAPGTAGSGNPGSCGGTATWYCTNGAYTSSQCTYSNPPCGPCPGQCQVLHPTGWNSSSGGSTYCVEYFNPVGTAFTSTCHSVGDEVTLTAGYCPSGACTGSYTFRITAGCAWQVLFADCRAGLPE